MIALLLGLVLDLLWPKGDLILENLALRQQILVLQRTQPRSAFSLADKTF